MPPVCRTLALSTEQRHGAYHRVLHYILIQLLFSVKQSGHRRHQHDFGLVIELALYGRMQTESSGRKTER